MGWWGGEERAKAQTRHEQVSWLGMISDSTSGHLHFASGTSRPDARWVGRLAISLTESAAGGSVGVVRMAMTKSFTRRALRRLAVSVVPVLAAGCASTTPDWRQVRLVRVRACPPERQAVEVRGQGVVAAPVASPDSAVLVLS